MANPVGFDQSPNSSWWSGTPAWAQRLPIFRENQEGILDQLLSSGSQGLQGMNYSFPGQGLLAKTLSGLENNNFDFKPIANEAIERFQTQIAPSIAERLGSLGGQSKGGSALPGYLSAAGAGLSRGLAAQQSQYSLQQQAQQTDLLRTLLGSLLGSQQLQSGNLQSLLGLGAQPRFQGLAHEAQPGLKQYLAQGAGAALPLAARIGLSYLGVA